MSCLENDWIWDALRDAFGEGLLKEEEYASMDLEEACKFLGIPGGE